MIDWHKKFNLNSYEWWKNHRRLVTVGSFIMLFGFYINPVIKEAKDKTTCARLAARAYTYQEAAKKLGLNSEHISLYYCQSLRGTYK